jgi:hypothetical protein
MINEKIQLEDHEILRNVDTGVTCETLGLGVQLNFVYASGIVLPCAAPILDQGPRMNLWFAQPIFHSLASWAWMMRYTGVRRSALSCRWDVAAQWRMRGPPSGARHDHVQEVGDMLTR